MSPSPLTCSNWCKDRRNPQTQPKEYGYGEHQELESRIKQDTTTAKYSSSSKTNGGMATKEKALY